MNSGSDALGGEVEWMGKAQRRLILGIRLERFLQSSGMRSHPTEPRIGFCLWKETNVAIYTLDGLIPRVAASAWVADSAQVIGDVVLGDEASVWFGSVVRGDTATLSIGAGSNIQDLSVLHADVGEPLVIGERVTVGHQAMLHGCTVGDESLIGIGAVVLNRARIGRHCLVGAGALVTEGKEFPDGSMIIGSPARVVKQLSPEQIEGLCESARRYMQNARRFRDGLVQMNISKAG